MQRKLWPLIGIFAVMLAGCSGSDIIVRKQVEMEGTLDRLTQENAALGLRVTKLGESVKELQTQAKATAGDPEVINHFRVQVESLQRQIAELNKNFAQMQQAQLQPGAAQHDTASGEGAPATHEAAAASRAEGKGASVPQGKRPPKESYDKAFALFNEHNYSGAAEAFERFAKEEPAHVLAPNAYYWAGECYYTLKLYPRALETFNKVVSHYPKAAKVPDAMLKVGFTEISLNDAAKAKKTLKSLVERYPKSPAATKARERLAHL